MYYTKGKALDRYAIRPYDDTLTYRNIDSVEPSLVPSNVSTWILPNKMLHHTRNHDSVILENGRKQQLLVNVLGRHNRHVEVMDLMTGEQWASLNPRPGSGTGWPLNDLNHVYTVLVNSVKNGTLNGYGHDESGRKKKELWLPCGFKNDRVKMEKSVHYARIVDLETLEIRSGPKLPYSGGACVALSLEIIRGEPPMICTFGGTIDSHESGKFLPYSSCYDRLRERWWFPFGKLPMAFDHGSVAFIPPRRCQENDPGRIIILNFRTESFGTQRSEMMAYDLPGGGWDLEQLQGLDMEESGSWYIYTNVSYGGPTDRANCPRDASGGITANNGRDIVNFGGIYYDFPNGNFRATRFSTIRSFDVCKKTWTVVGDLGVQTFAVQTTASEELQISVTCGGEARNSGYPGMNSPWCIVHRLGSNRPIENRHGAPAIGISESNIW
eukprot:CAMPEP_0178540048 /NCGR_PEP_ID=MMETSP0697-20121206/827_1 /TAXON_ID=265572 /ORGANISM="Extubocellulus spinifer, Strain CCMP396" /LENGTH=439 /DNA_ID=CAMNT_0020172375 /DNA_START=331 /DNA_END=1646 /DNA_ORIENTATION=-